MSRAAWACSVLALAIAAAVLGVRRPQPDRPLPAIASASNAVEAKTCAECHNDIYRRFAGSPHELTLRHGDDDALWEHFAGREVETPLGRFRFERDAGQLWFHSDRHPQRVRVDWLFGSGQDALTPVTLRENLFGELELHQLHVSWFPKDGLGLTFGSEQVAAEPATLGIFHSSRQAAECFECHASYLPHEAGRIDLQRMIPGVSCTRCHPGGHEHVISDGEVSTQTPWQELTPLESIQRCGECHRRADQMTEDEIHRDHAGQLARFAPVGLSLSRCFTEPLTDHDGKPLRMDCMTCHDPHTPLETNPDYYRQRCIQCHGEQPHQAPRCRAQPMTTNCLPCHMPKVPIGDHLSVTDHWIRPTATAVPPPAQAER